MADLRRVHRFCDHKVAGVNWRPTRFVDEVPPSHVCDLCRMIPKRITVLPCGHILCNACHVAPCRGCGGRCPFDQEPFAEEECSGYDLPAKKASTLKVYCWNEEFGCPFQGAIEDMLGHYEKECTFHTIECPRCLKVVLHRKLPAHYAAGCGAGISSARSTSTSSQSAARTFQEAMTRLEKLTLKDTNDEQPHIAIRNQARELKDQSKNQTSRSAVTTREIAAHRKVVTAKADTAQVAAEISPTGLQEPICGQVPTEQDRTPSTSLSCSKSMLRPRKPDPFAELPRDVMRNMRKTSSLDYPQHAITRFDPMNAKCYLDLTTPLSATGTSRKPYGCVSYVLTLTNIDKRLLLQKSSLNIAEITVLHARDAYFTAEISKKELFLSVHVMFHRFLGFSRGSAPSLKIRAYDWKRRQMDSMPCDPEPHYCAVHGHSWVHCNRCFVDSPDFLIRNNYFRNGNIKFELEVDFSRE